MKLDTYCSYCGALHTNTETYPKRCENCGNVTFLGAPAVGVGLVTINDRLLVCRRAIQPFIGEWALPAGFKNRDETWQQCIAREVFEETGIRVNPDTIILGGDLPEPCPVRTASNGAVLIFGLCAPIVLPEPVTFTLDSETSEAQLIRDPIEVCFPHHAALIDWYFAVG